MLLEWSITMERGLWRLKYICLSHMYEIFFFSSSFAILLIDHISLDFMTDNSHYNRWCLKFYIRTYLSEWFVHVNYFFFFFQIWSLQRRTQLWEQPSFSYEYSQILFMNYWKQEFIDHTKWRDERKWETTRSLNFEKVWYLCSGKFYQYIKYIA